MPLEGRGKFRKFIPSTPRRKPVAERRSADDSPYAYRDDGFVARVLGARSPPTPPLADIGSEGSEVAEEEDIAERFRQRRETIGEPTDQSSDGGEVEDDTSKKKKNTRNWSALKYASLVACKEELKRGPDAPPLEELLTAGDLKVLRRNFKSERVGKAEFVQIMKKSLATLCQIQFNPKELDLFFELVNPLLEDDVNWESICRFAFEERLKQRENRMAFQQPKWSAFRLLPHHGSRITAIELDTGEERSHYLTVTRTGIISRFDVNFLRKEQKQVEETLLPRRTIWVHHAVVMHGLDKIAVALSTKCILIYDIRKDILSGLSREKSFPLIHRVSGFTDNVVNHLYFWHDKARPRKAKLLVCDDGGVISVFHFSNAFSSFFLTKDEMWRSDIGATQRTDEINVLVNNGQFAKQYIAAKFSQFQPNRAPVKQVHYLSSMKAYLTCHFQATSSFIVTYARRQRSVRLRIPHGCDAFVYDPTHGMLATGGYDFLLRLWRPFHDSTSICSLEGHTAPIIHISMMPHNDQLMTLCHNRTIRVWDMLGQSCLQVLKDPFPSVKDFYSFIVFHDKLHSRFLFAFDKKMFHVAVNSHQDEPRSHKSAVTACVYVQSTEQVVTCARDFALSFWAINTGQRIHRIEECHGRKAITSLELAWDERLLVSGDDDHLLKVWNVERYECVLVLSAESSTLTGAAMSLAAIGKKVFAVGWLKSIVQYTLTKPNTFFLSPLLIDSEMGHSTFICHAVAISSLHLATVSYNLEIMVWNTRTGQVVSHVNSPWRRRYSARMIKSAAQPGKGKPGAPTGGQGKARIQASLTAMLRKFPFSAQSVPEDGVSAPADEQADANTNTALQRTAASLSAPLKSRSVAGTAAAALPTVTDGPLRDGRHCRPRRESRNCPEQKEADRIADIEQHLSDLSKNNVGSLDGHYASSDTHVEPFHTRSAFYLKKRRKTHANLVTSGHDRYIYFWNLVTGRCQSKFRPFASEKGKDLVICTACEHSKMLATGNRKGSVKLWDITSYGKVARTVDLLVTSGCTDEAPRCLVEWQAHTKEITCLRFANHCSGNVLVTTCIDGSVLLWTEFGEKIGIFGQNKLWHLENHLDALYKKILDAARAESAKKASTEELAPAATTAAVTPSTESRDAAADEAVSETAADADKRLTITRETLAVHDRMGAAEQGPLISQLMRLKLGRGMDKFVMQFVPTSRHTEDVYTGEELAGVGAAEEIGRDSVSWQWREANSAPLRRRTPGSSHLAWRQDGVLEVAEDHLLDCERRLYNKSARSGGRSSRIEASNFTNTYEPSSNREGVPDMLQASLAARRNPFRIVDAGKIEILDGGKYRPVSQEDFRSLSRASGAFKTSRIKRTPQERPVQVSIVPGLPVVPTQHTKTAASSFCRVVAALSISFDHEALNKEHPGPRICTPARTVSQASDADTLASNKASWDTSLSEGST